MKLLVVGDFCPLYRVADAFEKENYASVLDDFKALTMAVDYSIVNFECPVVTGNAKPIDKMGPNLRCTPKGVSAIKWAGFSCVTLANNHFFDYGEDGVRETLETLDAEGIDHVGGGLNLSESAQILYKDIADERLAIINCCEHEFSIATETTAGSNPLNPVCQYYAIKEAKANADRVLVIVHGGHEHFQLPSPRMVETYRFFIDAGADAVVNHHQHCYSGYEVYHGRPIFYGIGNLCFDNPEKRFGNWTEGYGVAIDFSNEVPSFVLHPFCQCATNASVKLLPDDVFFTKLTELNKVISNSDALRIAIEKYYDDCSDQYTSMFEPIRNRYYLGAKRRGWLPSFISRDRKLLLANFLVCESHYDKVKRLLMK